MIENKEISIIELIIIVNNAYKYLLRKWLIILLIAILGGSLGILYAWLKKPQYIAVISFFSEADTKSGLGAYAGIASQFGFDIGGAQGGVFEGENLIELLRSKNLITKSLLTPVEAGSKQLMIDKYLSDNEINKDWDKDKKYRLVKFEQNLIQPDRIRDSILGKVVEGIAKGELNVQKRDKKLDLIDVIMSSGNEYFSKRFVELLTSNAIQYYTEYKVKKARQNVDLLQKQTDSVRNILFGSITQVAEMSDVNVNPLRQIVRIGVQRRQVDVQTSSIVYGELLKNLELAKLSLRRETPLIQVVDLPILPLKKVKPGRLLTGVGFAFMFTFFAIFYFLIKKWLQGQYETKSQMNTERLDK